MAFETSAAPLVLVTSIPRAVRTTLGIDMDNATVNQRFGALVTAAGGIPVCSDAWAPPERLADRIDAVVINGGTDVDPGRYGAERLASTDEPDVRRDAFELALARAALERGRPVLGICRGMQLLNVLHGGTLVQDLAGHYVRDPHDRRVHDVSVDRDSMLGRALGADRAAVNSVHHQAVERLGEGLRPTAWADDGVIEALEGEDGLVFGVQWHPEFMAAPALDQVAIFRGFLEHARARVG